MCRRGTPHGERRKKEDTSVSNKEIYRKTLTFSLRKLIIDIIALLAVGGFCTLDFILME